MGLRVRGKLALIESPEPRPRAEAPVEAGFDQRRIARDRDARDRERRARCLEGQRRVRGHVAEGMLPLQRGTRHQHGAVGQRHRGGSAYAEPGIADVVICARARERRNAAALEERTVAQVHVGQPGERLNRDMTKAMP